MKPKYSVITVHYNQLPLLKSTVENVINQKGFGELIEYIIVDGMSSDRTVDYLHSLQTEKSIVKIVERDKGIYDAMNKGIQVAKGDYIIFINAGDQFYKNDTLFKISTQQENFDVLYADTEIMYSNFTRIAKTKLLSKFWKSLPFVHQSVVIKRDLLLENLFDLNYLFCADYNQLAKLYLNGAVFFKNENPISIILAGGTSDVNAVKATKEVFSISKKHFRLTFFQKMYFKFKIMKQRFSNLIKKMLPTKSVNSITKLKYN